MVAKPNVDRIWSQEVVEIDCGEIPVFKHFTPLDKSFLHGDLRESEQTPSCHIHQYVNQNGTASCCAIHTFKHDVTAIKKRLVGLDEDLGLET